MTKICLVVKINLKSIYKLIENNNFSFFMLNLVNINILMNVFKNSIKVIF